MAFAVAAPVATICWPHASTAQPFATDAMPLKSRNIGVSREGANKAPHSEVDQTIADGWPLYRTERGQAAFNDAMATLKATEGPSPTAGAFRQCPRLDCNIILPRIGADGWLQPGRIWISPSEYVLVVHSPRLGPGQSYRRRNPRDMRVFVYHEFENSSRNTDPYDTISSHKGTVFVPLYMTKQAIDAKGRQYVIVLQVAPYDVQSIHATNWGSAGPGMEMAQNRSEPLEPLQGLAGIVVATMIKTAAPQLRVVNHRNIEGLEMLKIWEQRLAAQMARHTVPTVILPFVAAAPERVATATARLSDLVGRGRGSVPRIAAPTSIASPPPPTLIARGRLSQAQ